MQLQVYTRKLEEKVDWLSQLLRQEKEHSNDFMQSKPFVNDIVATCFKS